MSPRPTKTLSVQIKLQVWRPNTFNYSKYHHRRFRGLTSDKWNANQAVLHREGIGNLGALSDF